MKKPSITTLVGLLDKPALLGWANKIGLEGIKLSDYRKQSTKKGIDLHNQIKNFLLHETPFNDPVNEDMFFDFLDNNKIESVFQVEKEIETEWFVGRYDIFLQANNKKYVCDFKSSNAIYFEQVLQLTGYKMAEKECEGVAVISIPDFTFKPLEIEFELYEEIIKSLYDIYIKRARIKELGMIA